MTGTDERERDAWTYKPTMSKQDKLEEIRRMRDELMIKESKPA